MEDEDFRRFQSIQRCDDLLREQKFPGTAIRTAAKRLATVRAELEALKVRESDAKGMTPWDGKEIRKRSRNLRLEYLVPIARAFKAIDGFMMHTPGAATALKVPHLTHTAALHVEAGERFAKFIEEHEATFLSETGFDQDTLSKLRAVVNELRTQSQFATRTRNERSALLRDIKARLTKGRNQIDLLKSLVEPFLTERKLEGRWAKASRVGPKKGRPRDTPEQRQEKRIERLKRQKERLEEQQKKREARKKATQARKALEADLKKQKAMRKKARKDQPQPVQPPVLPPPGLPPTI